MLLSLSVSLRLYGYMRTLGWPVDPTHRPSWSEYQSPPSSVVRKQPVLLELTAYYGVYWFYMHHSWSQCFICPSESVFCTSHHQTAAPLTCLSSKDTDGCLTLQRSSCPAFAGPSLMDRRTRNQSKVHFSNKQACHLPLSGTIVAIRFPYLK